MKEKEMKKNKIAGKQLPVKHSVAFPIANVNTKSTWAQIPAQNLRKKEKRGKKWMGMTMLKDASDSMLLFTKPESKCMWIKIQHQQRTLLICDCWLVYWFSSVHYIAEWLWMPRIGKLQLFHTTKSNASSLVMTSWIFLVSQQFQFSDCFTVYKWFFHSHFQSRNCIISFSTKNIYHCLSQRDFTCST